MYQPYPGGAQPPEGYGQPTTTLPIPPSVTRAVQIMYAGAVASLIGIVIDLTTLGSLRSQIRKRSPNMTPAHLTDAVHFEIGLFIVVGLIGAAVWIWMAQSSKAGKGWARIVSTVLFAIDTIGALAGLAGGSFAGGGATRIYGLLIWLIGLAAIVLLWRRTSSEYFKPAPRY
jgi:hypothetical protein